MRYIANCIDPSIIRELIVAKLSDRGFPINIDCVAVIVEEKAKLGPTTAISVCIRIIGLTDLFITLSFSDEELAAANSLPDLLAEEINSKIDTFVGELESLIMKNPEIYEEYFRPESIAEVEAKTKKSIFNRTGGEWARSK